MLKRAGDGPRWRTFLAAVIRLPGIHGPAKAVTHRLPLGRPQVIRAVIEQRPGHLRLEHQQRWIHPQLTIPEDVPIVAQTG